MESSLTLTKSLDQQTPCSADLKAVSISCLFLNDALPALRDENFQQLDFFFALPSLLLQLADQSFINQLLILFTHTIFPIFQIVGVVILAPPILFA